MDYSQPNLTFDDIGLDYGADTQGLTDFDHYEFTLPSQTQASQTQGSSLTQIEHGIYVLTNREYLYNLQS